MATIKTASSGYFSKRQKKIRLRWSWCINGVSICICSLLILVILGFIHASQAYAQNPGSLSQFQLTFANSMIKSLILVSLGGIFIYYISTQDRRMTNNKLDQALAESLPKQETSQIEPALISAREMEWLRQELLFMNCINSADFPQATDLFVKLLDSSAEEPPASEAQRYRMLCLSNMMVAAIGRVQVSVGNESIDYPMLCQGIINSRSLPELRGKALDVLSVLHEQSLTPKNQSFYSRISCITRFVQEHYDDQNLSVTQLANQFGLNPSYLSRSFKKSMNIGLAAYIQNVRVEAAKELLKDQQVSVKCVAEQVGFNNALTMNRAFRRQEGTTAGQLRRTDFDDIKAS